MDSSERDVVGRGEEIAALVDFLDPPASVPGVLLLEGEAGIGKTTLWRRGIELAQARAYRVLSCRPSDSEAQLSFVALGDLLGDTLEAVLPALPKPQANALAVALLVDEAEGPPPDQRAIALAFVGALRMLAQQGPVVVAVDDIQWLDRSSAFVLEFALRRLGGDALAFLLALREEKAAPATLDLERALPEERLRRLRIGPLSLGAVHRLVNDRLDLVLSRPRLRRLRELSGGNPLFALELGRAVRRGAIRLEAGEPLPGSLATLVRDRLAVLPADTRAALLAVSGLSHPTLALVARAAGGSPEQRLAPAFMAHVIELEGDRIQFTHPLLASGVYAAAGSHERRALHRRLAELLSDPEECARHLALGVNGPDAGVATAIEHAAKRAHARGALAAAAELSEQARRLTPAEMEDSGHRRAIQAASYAWEAGESDRARELLDEARAVAPPGPRHGEVLHWLGTIQEYEGDRGSAVELFREARSEAGGDVALQARIEEGLASCLFLMRSDLAAAADHARAAVALAERAGDRPTRIGGLSELGLIDAVRGGNEWRLALECGRELEEQAGPVPVAASPTFCLAVVLGWVDELAQARRLFRSLREYADERAEESALPWILAQLGWLEYLAGRWAEASQYAEEGIEIALQTGQEPQRLFAVAVRALVQASRGDVDGTRVDAETTLALAEDRGVTIASTLASSALGLLELSLGHHDAVHALLGPLRARLEEGGVREPGSVRFVPDEIEALIGLGRLEEAEPLLDILERQAGQLDRASALAAAGRCRGLLAASRGDLDGALASLEKALAEHERVSMPFEHARTLLALGATRRRAKMKRPAREALEQALASFEELGAAIWAEKARAELTRIGGRPAATGQLTPTERRVAALVAEGRSNKEVAASLFVTVKTVEANLSRIYAKLGLRSRTELTHRLTADKPEESASKQ
jgi:DNA-binding CsgD family transcriptional regulator